jgi:hypothetical protein
MPRGASIVNSTSVTAYHGSPSLLEYRWVLLLTQYRSLRQLAIQYVRQGAAGCHWLPGQGSPSLLLRHRHCRGVGGA